MEGRQSARRWLYLAPHETDSATCTDIRRRTYAVMWLSVEVSPSVSCWTCANMGVEAPALFVPAKLKDGVLLIEAEGL